MSEFSYVRAHSLAEAVDLLNRPGLTCRVLAGGTELVNQFRAGQVSCDCVVDVAHVPELGLIKANGAITIGAAVTHCQIVESSVLQERVPFLVRACAQIGSPQIRNIATIGGNVVNAAACADSLPVLACLDAEAILVSLAGERRLPVADLVSGVNRTCLQTGELVSSFVFQAPPAGCGTAFVRIGRRQAMSIARLSLAAMGALDEKGRIAFCRLVPGAAFSRFRRVSSVEALLVDQQPSVALFAAAGKRMAQEFMAESGSRWSAPYKERTVAVLTERALNEVFNS